MKKQDSPYYLGARAGMPVGLYMSAMFLLMIVMSRVPVVSYLLLCMMLCMPVVIYATMRATVVSSKGETSYSSLWMQGIMTFLFGSVVCGLVTMVYLKFVEPRFIIGMVQTCVDNCRAMPGAEYSELADTLENMIRKGVVPTASSFTVSMFWFSMSSGSLLSAIVAAIARNSGRRYRNRKISTENSN